jgi:hypothetical protein
MTCWGAGCAGDSKPVKAEQSLVTDADLPQAIRRRLEEAGWKRRVGDALGLWVSVGRQQLCGLENGRVRFAYRCSTAAKGVGNREGSNQTPLGWHEIQERFGDGLPAGAIFKERKHKGKVWSPGSGTGDDLILSRIMWLGGLEPGINASPGIDSHTRYIYIHGTPQEDRLGTPASMGCIRLSNADVIELYEQTALGTPVFISAW